jgi:uncharacterized membrane protein YesL
VTFFEPFVYLWRSLGRFYYEAFSIVARANWPWTLAMVPWAFVILALSLRLFDDGLRDELLRGRVAPDILIGLPVVTAVVMLLTGPATAALYNSMIAREELESVTLGLFARGFKRYFFRAWRLTVVDLFILYSLLLAFIFYRAQEDSPVQVLAIVAIWPTFFWLMIQPYLFPLLLRTETGLYHVFRNASVLALGNLGNTLGLLIITLLSMSVVIPLNVIALTVGPAVYAMTGLRAVDRLLEKFELADEGSPGS